MMMDTAKAGEDIPYGSPVKLIGDTLHVSKPEDMCGIAKRPWVRGDSDSHYFRGEPVVYQISGEVMGYVNNAAEWLTLRGGKIVKS